MDKREYSICNGRRGEKGRLRQDHGHHFVVRRDFSEIRPLNGNPWGTEMSGSRIYKDGTSSGPRFLSV